MKLQLTTFIFCLSTSAISQHKNVRLITLAPGHFHAALVQKTMYPGVDSTVHVYAPKGPDVELHMDRIKGYNNRADEPTQWKENVYTNTDFFEKMLNDKAGNVVVLAGNNSKKTEYISKCLKTGFNVLADKPMAINTKSFTLLNEAFQAAKNKNLLLYDIMTERFEIPTILQRILSRSFGVFGTLQKGTPNNPAVTKIGVHYFNKYVSGNVLTRPAWFMDVTQEGEGIVDVTTHLVDLVQWECFPEQSIDYKKDIEVIAAKRWATNMSLNEFNALTKENSFPAYLKKDIANDTLLKVYCNGEINYKIKGVHASVSVSWNYKAPDGESDSHYSLMRGTKANLVIKQGKEEQFIPTLYIEPLYREPIFDEPAYEKELFAEIKNIQVRYPGVEIKKISRGWEVIIPEKYREGHEAHFARVTRNFLEYLRNGNMPKWEVPNMLAKYYTTTKGLEMALKNQQ